MTGYDDLGAWAKTAAQALTAARTAADDDARDYFIAVAVEYGAAAADVDKAIEEYGRHQGAAAKRHERGQVR